MSDSKEQILTIHTPYEDSVKVTIIEKEYVEQYKSIVESTYDIIKNFMGDIPVYLLNDSTVLMMITANDYALKFNNVLSYDKLSNEDYPGWFSFLKAQKENNYFYSFAIPSGYIEKMLSLPHDEVQTSLISTRHSSTINYKVIKMRNGTVIKYYERATNLYEGNWFYNEKQFLFYWENDFE